MPRAIQLPTLSRKEKIITETPVIIATAQASAATVMALRCMVRRTFSPAMRKIVCRAEAASRPAAAEAPGAKSANPAITKNAAAKESHAARPPSAAAEQRPASPRQATPPPAQRRMRPGWNRSRRAPWLKAATGSARAASWAGTHAPASTEASPSAAAAAKGTPSQSGERMLTSR